MVLFWQDLQRMAVRKNIAHSDGDEKMICSIM